MLNQPESSKAGLAQSGAPFVCGEVAGLSKLPGAGERDDGVAETDVGCGVGGGTGWLRGGDQAGQTEQRQQKKGSPHGLQITRAGLRKETSLSVNPLLL